MASTKGRKYHNWHAGVSNPDGSLTVTCKNCGLRERIYNEGRYRAEYFDSQDNLLDFTKRPDCPKTPTY